MQYLTYDEYKKLGGTLDKTAFEQNIHRVGGIITNATHGRIKKMKSIPDEVKILCRDLVDYLKTNHSTNVRAITGQSQSANGLSESESYAVKTNDELSAEINQLMYDYLGAISDDNGTPLLYRGCRV